jgi:hypothetical protein
MIVTIALTSLQLMFPVSLAVVASCPVYSEFTSTGPIAVEDMEIEEL